MKIESDNIRHIRVSLAAPFKTYFSRENEWEFILGITLRKLASKCQYGICAESKISRSLRRSMLQFHGI